MAKCLRTIVTIQSDQWSTEYATYWVNAREGEPRLARGTSPETH